MSIQEMIARLDAAMKGLTTTSTAGAAVLEPQQFDRYVRLLQHKTTILPLARFMKMTSPITDIDHIGFAGRVMGVPPAEGAAKAEADFVEPSFAQNQLTAALMQGVVGVTDSLVRRNVERAALMSTILDLMAERGGLDIEEQAINGDESLGGSEFLGLNDGWLKLTRRRCVEDSDARKDYDDVSTPLFTTGGAETTQQVIYDDIPIVAGGWTLWTTSTSGTQVAHDDGNGNIVQDAASGIAGTIDYNSGVVNLTGLATTTAYYSKYTVQTFDRDASSGLLFPENMFTRLIQGIPKTYYTRPGEWKICVPWWVLDAYHDILRARGTDLGDRMQVGSSVELPFKGTNILYVPNMPNGRSWLTHPDNTIYGVFHEVTVEQEREAKKKRTDVILDTETDYDFEEREATIVADIYS